MIKKRILFVTGSRGEWGYIRPILRLCETSDKVDYSLCVTNMHLLPSFGMSIDEIKMDGFEVAHQINMSLDGYNHSTMVKSLGIFLMSLADIISTNPPDWILLAGDRGEQLMGAIASAYCYIPVAHIQAGELSGNIDGMSRHAIGKFAHIHFASNQDAADRLIKLSEQPFRVHNVGAPQVDEMVNGQISDADDLSDRFGFDLNRDYLLVVQHPVTEEFDKASIQIEVTMDALKQFEMPKVVILPNNDAGSIMIREGIDRSRHREFHVFSNLKREDYLGFMKNAAAMVGNSSSGLLEAPTFKVPAVNLGRRQNARVQGTNVINASFEKDAIVTALKKALSESFRSSLANNCKNPYGDGKSSERILEIICNTKIDDELLIKNLTY